jgi:uncharacterized caspase-like protein
MVKRGILLMMFLAWGAAAVANATTGSRWLLAVGVQKFVDTRIATLAYTTLDADSLRDYFAADGVPAGHIKLLVNEQATKANILAALDTIRKEISPADTLFFFYSSHGVGDAQGHTYFVTFDTVIDELSTTALPMQLIKDKLENFGCENVILLADTCHSGGAKSLDRPHEESFNKLLRAANQKTRIAILTSSRTHESSLESPEWSHGVFTYYLLEGLSGQSDNYPADGQVSVTELFDYLLVAVPRATDRAQHPSARFSYNWPKEKTEDVRFGKVMSKTTARSLLGAGAEKKAPVAPAAAPENRPAGWENVINGPNP